MKWIKHIGLACILILPVACTDSKTTQNEQLILGRWELVQAVRNGKPTDSMNGIFFEFKEEGKMTSNFNLAVEERQLQYTIDKNLLDQIGEENLKYIIEKLTNSELILTTNYQGLEFQLQLEP